LIHHTSDSENNMFNTECTSKKILQIIILFYFILFISLISAIASTAVPKVRANRIIEISFKSSKSHTNPFTQVTLDVEFTDPSGVKKLVPAFWAGKDEWKVRYASPHVGVHQWRTICDDVQDIGLHGVTGKVIITPNTENSSLFRHGPIGVSNDRRHFEHSDGTPFLWLGDTWWKCLSKRLSWTDFQELTANRRENGFNVVQIVCGPYPDENMMEARWENEGGKPYEKIDFSIMNPSYFEYADRRLFYLMESGIVPAIVGGWGRPQGNGKSTLLQVGLEGYKRHWRHLIARYGALPVVWILGGEASDGNGPWSALALYVDQTDPYHRPLVYHSPGDPRKMIKSNNELFDFDMAAIGHEGMKTADKTLELLKSCMSASPARPFLCGEASYEGHMQTNFQDIQRYMFWSFMLSGAAGHTYGAAGIWHAGVEGDAGHTGFSGQEYDFTTWKEGMKYPGAIQVGLGKKLLEQYAWWHFHSYPEWAPGCFAAGIPREVRIIYLPKRNIYNWAGPQVLDLEADLDWHVYYFDPATGRKFDQGIIRAVLKKENSAPNTFNFQKNVPSPQDWILVFEALSSK